MIIMNVTYQLKDAGEREAFCAALTRENVISRTQAEDGCNLYRFSLPLEETEQVFLLEIWENGETMAAHKKTPQCQTLQDIKARYVANTSFEQYEL